MQEYDGTAGVWTIDITDNAHYALNGHIYHLNGDYVRVHFQMIGIHLSMFR